MTILQQTSSDSSTYIYFFRYIYCKIPLMLYLSTRTFWLAIRLIYLRNLRNNCNKIGSFVQKAVVKQKKYIKLLLAYIFTVPVLILYPSHKMSIIILLFSDYYAKLFALYVTRSVLLPFHQLPCTKDHGFKFPTDQLAP